MRKARCHCGREEVSSEDLPFFQNKDAKSREALEVCQCGFHKSAHLYSENRVNREPIVCSVGGFTPK